jgi:hypothetical protein
VTLAYNPNMKRLVLSLVGGVAIPFLYTIIVGPLSTYIQNPDLNALMSFPVRWPVIILMRFLHLDSFLFRNEDEIPLLLFIVISNVLLYSFVTYVLLLRFWKRKTPQIKPPPDPPLFVNDENA